MTDDLRSARTRDVHDSAIVHFRNAVGVVEHARIVGHDDHGPPRSHGVGREQVHDSLAARVVQRRRRLVTHDESRLVNERTGNGDALLLAAGEGHGQRIEAMLQAELGQQVFRAVDRATTHQAGGNQRNGHVLGSRECRQQVELLEDESEILAPEEDPLVRGQIVRTRAENRDLACARIEQAGNNRDQGGLAAATGADQEAQLANARLEVNATERFDPCVPVTKMLPNPATRHPDTIR